MKQLISKDVLYEPMKEMYEKYPKWLSAHKSTLAPADYQNYVKQFGYIEQIMYIYDNQGDEGFGEVLRLMREVLLIFASFLECRLSDLIPVYYRCKSAVKFLWIL